MNDIALPSDGMRDQRHRLSRTVGHMLHDLSQRADVMTVDFAGIPAERGPFVAQRRQHQCLVGPRGGLATLL